jgi:hypothetical protein
VFCPRMSIALYFYRTTFWFYRERICVYSGGALFLWPSNKFSVQLIYRVYRFTELLDLDDLTSTGAENFVVLALYRVGLDRSVPCQPFNVLVQNSAE